MFPPDALRFQPSIKWEPDLPSPGGIPPWDPPDDMGELFAHEGWAEWVQEHGNTRERLQLFAYQIEQLKEVFVAELTPAVKMVASAINRFGKSLAEGFGK